MVANDAAWDAADERNRKVAEIFKQFDRNKDDRLSREEMAELVVAVNPRVKFNDKQITAILDEVFRTYGEFIDEEKGLNLQGLKQTYDDGAGDVNRDFEALQLTLPPAPIPTEPTPVAKTPVDEVDHTVPVEPEVLQQEPTVSDGLQFETTRVFLKNLQTLLAQHTPASDNLQMSPALVQGLAELRQRADGEPEDAALEAHISMGRELLQKGLAGAALLSLGRALELSPGSMVAHFLNGNAQHALGQLALARSSYERSLAAANAAPIAHNALLPQVHVNLGIVLEEEGLLLGACQHYLDAAQLNPQHYRALKLLGSAQAGAGDPRAAESFLLHALALKEDNADARCELGSVYHTLGEAAQAQMEFERALQLEPEHTVAQYNLAGLSLGEGNFTNAAQGFNRVVNQDPSNWRARLNLSVALLGTGDISAAQQRLQETLEMTNRVEVYDALRQLQRVAKTNREQSVAADELSYTVADPERMAVATPITTPAADLSMALDVRAFQKRSRLGQVNVHALAGALPTPGERKARKVAMEAMMRRLLPPAAVAPEAFRTAFCAINERVLSALDAQDPAGQTEIDVGLAVAAMAPLCAGSLKDRYKVAYDALLWHSQAAEGQLARSMANTYLSLLRRMYIPAVVPMLEVSNQTNGPDTLTLAAFIHIMETELSLLLVVHHLEGCDRKRHGKLSCAVCSYDIVGPRFRETTSKFNLCPSCYSERKIPNHAVSKEYQFREY